MQIVDKYGNTFGQGHLIVTGKSGKPKVPTVTVEWGNITGILKKQSDLQKALDLKVPIDRTITINGNTQDLSADRTWTISTGITIGSTSITSGTVGRILFEGAGNVVQQSSSLFWDAPNDRLIVGSTGSSGVIAFPTTTSGFSPIIQSQFGGNNIIFSIGGRNFTINGSGTITTNFNTTITGSTGSAALVVAQGNSAWSPVADFNGSSGTALRINTNGNVLIGTTTDAGYKLDVNGSTRVQNGLTVSGSLNLNSSDISSTWTAYTPTWSTDGATQPSLGNGTITGAYKVIGKTVFVRVRLVFGTTTTAGTGAFYFSLPVSAATAWSIQMPVSILDNGNAWYQATVNGEYGGFTDRVALITQSAGGTNSSQGVTGVFPITFANTDSIQFNGSYESA